MTRSKRKPDLAQDEIRNLGGIVQVQHRHRQHQGGIGGDGADQRVACLDQRLAGFGLPVLADSRPLGPLSGILSGLRWAAEQGADALVSAPVDAPFLPGDLTPRLILAADGPGLAIASAGGRLHPTFGLWPVTLGPALEDFLASGAKPKVMDFTAAHHAAIADFPDDGAFANLNTPQDLAAAEALLGGGI